MLKHLARLFVSNSCYGCNHELTIQESCICLDCLSHLEETSFDSQADDNELYYRLAGRVPLASAAALYYFDKGGRLQHIIQQLKYEGAPQLGLFMGKYYGEKLKQSVMIQEVDTIIPVPLHPSRLRTRGYNQAERFASGLSDVLHIPVRTDLIQRVRRTGYQAKQVGAARWDNVKGAFRIQANLPKHILLVDDVITTGATIGTCLETLFSGEQTPESVHILCIGMTRQQ